LSPTFICTDNIRNIGVMNVPYDGVSSEGHNRVGPVIGYKGEYGPVIGYKGE